MYPADWHRTYGDKTGHSARAVMTHLLSIFPVLSSVEIGCGNGHWTQAGLDSGVEDYVVADGKWNDRNDLLIDPAKFQQIDLTKNVTFDRRFDMAICLEVAEHVPAAYADNIVETIVNASDLILFGAAIPFQGGYGHINEQWPSWWRAKFEARGYRPFDLVRPRFWKDESLHYWYRQNAFVYVSERRLDLMAKGEVAERGLYTSGLYFDAVVPEKFEEVASYQSLSFKRLARRLPSWTVSRVRDRLGLAR